MSLIHRQSTSSSTAGEEWVEATLKSQLSIDHKQHTLNFMNALNRTSVVCVIPCTFLSYLSYLDASNPYSSNTELFWLNLARILWVFAHFKTEFIFKIQILLYQLYVMFFKFQTIHKFGVKERCETTSHAYTLSQFCGFSNGI